MYFYLFYHFLEFLQIFPWILNNFCFTNIFVKISTDISDISVKSKYRYFKPCLKNRKNHFFFLLWNECSLMPNLCSKHACFKVEKFAWTIFISVVTSCRVDFFSRLLQVKWDDYWRKKCWWLVISWLGLIQSKNCGHAKFSGVQIYRKFYTKEKERSNGVLAICVAKSAAQPYIFLAYILFVSVFISLLVLYICLISWINSFFFLLKGNGSLTPWLQIWLCSVIFWNSVEKDG